MAIPDQRTALPVEQRIRLAARLRALSTVAAAAAKGVTQQALSAVTDAQRTVYEALEFDARSRAADVADLIER